MAEGDGFNIDNGLLIRLVETRPVLWDTTLQIHRDKKATSEAWREVCEQFVHNFDDLDNDQQIEICTEFNKRWKNMRDAYARSKKHLREVKAQGGKLTKRRKYIYSDELHFLSKLYPETEDKQTDVFDIVATEVTIDSGKQTTNNSVPKKLPRLLPKLPVYQEDLNTTISQTVGPKVLPVKRNCKMSFFESLLVHVDEFDSNEWLECQKEFLDTITNIKIRRTNFQQFSNSLLNSNSPMSHSTPTNVNKIRQPRFLLKPGIKTKPIKSVKILPQPESTVKIETK